MKRRRIDSKQNNRVKELVKLRQKKLLRENIGEFLIEGHKELSSALAGDVNVTELYYCPAFFRDDTFAELVDQVEARGAVAVEVREDVFEKISHREGPDGLLAVGKTWVRPFSEVEVGDNPLLVVVERVEKPGNLGNLIRSAEAAGADMMVVTDPVVDIFNPNVVRASRGAVFTLPIVVCSNEEADAYLEAGEIVPVAFSPHGKGEYWDATMAGPTAILCGSEFEGLSDFWMKHARAQVVKIPMHMQGDSLNVATAASLGLYEALRQRRA